jgi:two-component system chemotaxis response regulator CheB
LSGALDDGTAGLWTIKSRGGIAIVQHPCDAKVPSMPEHALQAVEIDYQIPIDQMGSLLTHLASEEIKKEKGPNMDENKKISAEIRYALQEGSLEKSMLQIGELTPFACPECHGVLSSIKDGDIIRYRCHTGHAYSADSLLTSITENIEDALWNTIRGIEESIFLLNNLGDHYAEKNYPQLAAQYFKKAHEAEERVKLIRNVVLDHEQLNEENIREQANQAEEGNTNGAEDEPLKQE